MPSLRSVLWNGPLVLRQASLTMLARHAALIPFMLLGKATLTNPFNHPKEDCNGASCGFV